MICVYPVILSKEDNGYFVTVPDFGINTQGADLANAIYMARDAIGLMGIDYEDDGKVLPEPSVITGAIDLKESEILTLVDVDFVEHRRKVDGRAVKKNCTLPYWIVKKADKLGVNYSRELQEVLVTKYNLKKG